MNRAERMHAIATGDGRWTPVTAHPAATVVLVRDTTTGIETYLQRRPMTMRFAPGMWVFPGGRVDSSDADDLATAVREVREEAGVEISRDALTFFDHWITPEVESRRFDVRFFLARVSAEVRPVPADGEVDEDIWLNPAGALERFNADAMPMLRPTLAVLDWLGGFPTVRAACDAARERDIRPRLPRPVLVGDHMHWVEIDVVTGEILSGPVPMPHAWEDLGATSDIDMQDSNYVLRATKRV